MSKEGIFKILDFTTIYNNYLVFISPYNGEIWGNFLDSKSDHVADITFLNPKQLPNMAPFFSSPPKPINILTNDSLSIFEFSLPKILDSGAD